MGMPAVVQPRFSRVSQLRIHVRRDWYRLRRCWYRVRCGTGFGDDHWKRTARQLGEGLTELDEIESFPERRMIHMGLRDNHVGFSHLMLDERLRHLIHGTPRHGVNVVGATREATPHRGMPTPRRGAFHVVPDITGLLRDLHVLTSDDREEQPDRRLHLILIGGVNLRETQNEPLLHHPRQERLYVHSLIVGAASVRPRREPRV